jgi:predicted metal-dependent hydrolase
VTDRGTVRVTIPRRGSKREAMAFADRERAWIDKQWRRYVAGLEKQRERTEPDPAQASQANAQRERAKRELPLRLMALASTLGVADRVTKISVRNQKWRWGSCSPSGHICLNWRLAAMPDAVRDYVLIHELMHLRRMDHSPKFWKLVAEACPDYRAHRQFLRAQRA